MPLFVKLWVTRLKLEKGAQSDACCASTWPTLRELRDIHISMISAPPRLIVRFMGCGFLDFLLLVILNGRYFVELQEPSGGVVHTYEANAIAK